MKLQDVVEVLYHLEAEFDVTGLKVDEVCVWPILRQEIAHKLRNQSSHLSGGGNAKGLKFVVRRLMLAFINFLRPHGDMNCKNNKVWFLTGAHYHTEVLNGVYFDRFADPLIDLLGKHRVLKVEALTARKDKRPRHNLPVYIDLRSAMARAQSHAEKHLFYKIERYAEFASIAQKITKSDLPNESDVLLSFLQIREMKIQLVAALRRSCPAAVFVVCYYSTVGLALTWAARSLGIPVIDVQHGKQGKFHVSYTHWSRLPQDGYDMLPDYFWVWGEQSLRNIEAHMPIPRARHYPVVGGNLLMTQWKNFNVNSLDAERDLFTQHLRDFDKTILITLQPIPSPLPDHVLTAIKDSPPTWCWLIRMHPTMTKHRDELSIKLDAYAPGRFEIDMASRLPLYSLLSQVDHHLTGWSSVAYEALEFNVPTTIFHETGAALYKEDIATGVFKYAESPKGLIAALSNDSKVARSEPYIIADADHVHRTIEGLLNRESNE